MKKYDLIVGIPSLDEADSIAYVAEQASKGLKKYYPQLSSLIINVDNASLDGTKEAFLNADTEVEKEYISTPKGVKGKGNNFYNLFKAVLNYESKAVVVVDADLKSITPEWIKFLVDPILEGNDFVTPIYSRHKYDGTITNNIIYPMVYGVLGKDIRQPIGGDFSFSFSLAKYWLSQDWSESTRQFGIDIFMSMHAVLGGFKIAQTGLGAKIHKPSAPKLSYMFVEVVNTLFKMVLDNKEKWQEISSLEKTPMFGLESVDPPQEMSVDADKIAKQCYKEFSAEEKMLEKFLSPDVFKIIQKSFLEKNLYISSEIWAKAVFDFLASYLVVENKEDVIEAMKAIYFTRVVSFYKESMGLDYIKAEKMIVEQAKIFEKEKPYLLMKLSAIIKAPIENN